MSQLRGPEADREESPLPDGPDLPLLPRDASAPTGSIGCVPVTVAAGHWAGVRAQAAARIGAGTTGALAFQAFGSVLALWSRRTRFTLQLLLDDTKAGAPASGATSALGPVLFDEGDGHTFAERAIRLTRNLERATRHRPEASKVAGSARPLVVGAWSAVDASPAGVCDSDTFFSTAFRQGSALAFHVGEDRHGALQFQIAYVPAAFPDGMIEDLAHSLSLWLHALAGPEAWAMTPAEQAWHIFPPRQMQRRKAVNATGAPLSSDRLFSGFLRHVSHAPDRVAVITPGRTLTYGQLYGYACSLAHELHARGIRRNELVGIAAEKGWEQVAAALGVTMAGAAYLPVDLDLPADRIRFLLEYGETRVVVTQSRHLATLPRPETVFAIALDQLEPAGPGTAPPDIEVTPDDLAYVIFTSGSTGTPKGVKIDHRGAVNTIADLNARFQIRADDRVLALSRLSFDLSVYDIFGLLAAGGSLVLPAPDLARDPSHWAELVRKHGVTLWNTVPALMQLLVDAAADGGETPGTSIRLVWMSGDWIPLALPDRIRKLMPRAHLVSLGGATEASIWSILHPIHAVDPAWKSIPYGRPMVNQTFHVLRDDLSPTPDYASGELFIGGVGVARGYWRDPEKTRARFIVHPHTGERLYRTGDLGRFLPDGMIEFLGRSDFQVKIRGFRIEPGEIETALAAHAGIRAAVVVACGDSDNTRQLVAYVVTVDGSPAPVEEVRTFLAARLPAYMVPAIIVTLERLPLTSNGKVDLKALPAPGSPVTSRSVQAPHAVPTTEIEEIVLSLWQEILGLATIGIHDDFFALGGNSLSGTRLVIRLRSAFALPLPVQCLFQNPTIHRLAAALEQLLLTEIALEAPTA